MKKANSDPTRIWRKNFSIDRNDTGGVLMIGIILLDIVLVIGFNVFVRDDFEPKHMNN